MNNDKLRSVTVSIAMLLLASIVAACAEEEPILEGAEDPAGSADSTGDASEGEQATVRMQLSWIPDCQFAGYLQADEQGIYAENNLDVELLPGGPNVNAIQQVVTGGAELTVNKVAALYAARDQGLPIVSVAQFDQQSSFPLVAFADTGIEEAEDLAGNEIGIWYDGDEYEVLALLDKVGIDAESDVELFEQGFTMEPFINREYDVAMVTSFNEINVLYLEGVAEDELNIINPSDHDISIPHGSLLANSEWVTDNADAAARFLAATIEGWNYAFDNPEETASLCAETSLAAGGEAATESLEELQARMIASMEELHFSAGYNEEDHGRIDPALYQGVADIVYEYGLIEEQADVEASFDLSIWEAATAG